MMSVHVEDIFMAGNPETLKNIRENIKEKFNISESGKAKKLLGFYYEWGLDTKVTYEKNNHEQRHKEACRRLQEVYVES